MWGDFVGGRRMGLADGDRGWAVNMKRGGNVRKKREEG